MTTHNGRGGGSDDDAQPASTTPREGVVLPAHGEPWSPQQASTESEETPDGTPTSGHSWGAPWGPASEAAMSAPEPPSAPPQPVPPQGARAPQQFGGPVQSQPQPSAQPAPEQGEYGGYGYPQPQQDPQPQPQPPHHAVEGPQTDSGLPVPREMSEGGLDRAELPPLGAESGYPAAPQAPGAHASAPHPGPMPVPGQPGGGLPDAQYAPGAPESAGPLTGQHASSLPPEGAPLPPAEGTYAGAGAGPLPQPGAGTFPQAGPHSGQPPQQGQAPGQQPGHQPPYQAQQSGQPPEAADAESTQMLPPMVGADSAGPPSYPGAHGSEDGTQLLPPQAPHSPAPDEAATQYIAPITDGAGESTQTLRTPLPPNGGGQPPAGGQAEPVRQPLAEFESLFRAEPAAPPPQAGGAAPTQSLPLFDQAAADQQRGFGSEPFEEYEPQGRAARRNAERGRGANPGVLVGVGIAAVVLIGLLAGALLGGDGDADESKAAPASTAPAGNEASSKAPVDPVEQQAKQLDALLADSNNSRTAVIRSVEAIKKCQQLPKAASDLRGAAQQRKSLVTRLQKLKTDKLPDSDALVAALNRAWRSSESADRHYANWAHQTAGKGGCPGGNAKQTPQVAAANRASGAATNAKKEAASLWNPTAAKYQLDKRQFSQL